MRRIQRGQQQRQARLLSTRKAPHGSIRLIGAKAKACQLRAQFGLHHTGAGSDHVLQRRLVNDQLVHLMLGKEPDAEFVGIDGFALEQHQTVAEQFGQCRFPLTVAAQQGDPVVLINPQIEAR